MLVDRPFAFDIMARILGVATVRVKDRCPVRRRVEHGADRLSQLATERERR